MIIPLRRLIALAGLLIAASPAAAHVHVTAPSTASTGSATTFTVGVPNERPDAATVKVSLRIPGEFTDIQPMAEAGWTRAEDVDGSDTVVTWEGGRVTGSDSAEFRFRAVATTAGDHRIPAVQTYDDGTVVRWIGAEGDEFPAPIVRIGGSGAARTAGSEHTVTATPASDDDGISTPAYIVGGLITLAIVGGVLLALRRRSDDA